jgi:hypothetical protein
MTTREIPRTEWIRFFDNFSRKHDGWTVLLEVFGPAVGDQVQEHDMQLSGVTADRNGRNGSIEIMIGAQPDRHVTHIISQPTDVYVRQNAEGVDDTLRIKSADGATTLLYLQ